MTYYYKNILFIYKKIKKFIKNIFLIALFEALFLEDFVNHVLILKKVNPFLFSKCICDTD